MRRFVAERFCKTEIEHLDASVRRDLDVGGLQVAMDDPFLVGGFQGLGDVTARSVDASFEGQRVRRDSSASVGPSTSSRMSAWMSSASSYPLIGSDEGMIQRRQHPCLALEAYEPVWIGSER